MGIVQRPSPSNLNTELLVSESVPAQIRIVQSKLRELTASHAKYSAQLRRLLELAIVEDVELCPAPPTVPGNGNAAGPGGADGVTTRGEVGEPASVGNLASLARGRA